MATDQVGKIQDNHITDVELRCPPNHAVLSLIRQFIANIAEEMGFPKAEIDQIEICVDEACANVIDHAYRDVIEKSGEKKITRLRVGDDFPSVSIRISIALSHLTITITDKGVGNKANFNDKPFDPEEYANREKPRGLGLHIIRKLMDSVDLEFPDDNGTRLIMTKLLRG